MLWTQGPTIWTDCDRGEDVYYYDEVYQYLEKVDENEENLEAHGTALSRNLSIEKRTIAVIKALLCCILFGAGDFRLHCSETRSP